MSADEKIIALFRDSIEAHANHGEFLAPLVAAAGELAVNALVQGRQLLVCGQAASAVNAQYLAMTLLNQGARERPGLPAQLLDGNATLVSTISQSYGVNEIYARQINALGREGDVLVVFTTADVAQSLVNAVKAAHRIGMSVILFSGGDRGPVAHLLDGDDIEIRVPVAFDPLVHEMHMLMSSGFCDLIDDSLFGERSDE